MESQKICSIDVVLTYLGKKWSLHIIRDLFQGKKRFNEFLRKNKNLSSKVLAERLKELEENKIINKKIVSTRPVLIEYELTKKGRSLDKLMKELADFAHENCSQNNKVCTCNIEINNLNL
ncbi:transcriptional regulator [Candidatus Woesearchaeota archaeon]|nr:MAG: transcriptional regulator [Candidatus Woesearchaeota archaeon]